MYEVLGTLPIFYLGIFLASRPFRITVRLLDRILAYWVEQLVLGLAP